MGGSNDDLIRLRNAIVNVYADNYAKQYPDVLNGNDLIKYKNELVKVLNKNFH